MFVPQEAATSYKACSGPEEKLNEITDLPYNLPFVPYTN